MGFSMGEIVNRARSELHALTGLEVSSTLEAAKEGDEWRVSIEVVEKRSIPDAMDILAIYETRVDQEGNMLEFKRVRMRKRIDTEESED